MTTFFRKHSTPVLFFLMLTFLALTWLFPADGLILGIIYLPLSLLIANSAVLEKHREAYQQGQITRRVFIRTTLLEITGLLLAMVLAGVLGRYAAGIAARQLEHGLLRTVAGMMIGLLVGIGVGASARKAWGRFGEHVHAGVSR